MKPRLLGVAMAATLSAIRLVNVAAINSRPKNTKDR